MDARKKNNMNEFEQFNDLLNGLEDSEHKANLSTAFSKVTGAYDKIKTDRKDLGKKLSHYESFTKKTLESLELDEDSSVDDVISKFQEARTGTNEDLKKAIEDERIKLEDRYVKQSNELRDALTAKDNDYNALKQQYQNLEFSALINESGLLGDALDNPMMQKTVSDHLKSQLLVKDGKLFVNDGDGEIAVNSVTNEKIAPKDILEKMKDEPLWQPFFKPRTSVNGMGSKPNNPSNGYKKPEDLSEQDRVDLYRNNPAEFNRLFGQK